MNPPPPPLVDEDGISVHQNDRRSIDVKRLFFDWSSVVAIALAAMTYATLDNKTQTNADEIQRLRSAREERVAKDERIAETMATKADVQRVSDQVQALALELRRSRDIRP